MTEKPLSFTRHAATVCVERGLPVSWIKHVIQEPEWELPDLNQPDAVRRFRQIPEAGNRVLRVVCVETEVEVRVVTAFLDRRARRPD